MDFEDVCIFLLIGMLLGMIILSIFIAGNIADQELLDSVCKDKLGDSYKFDKLYRDDNTIQHIKCVKEEKYQLDGSENYIIKGD